VSVRVNPNGFPVADAHRVGVAERERRQRARVRVDLEHGEIGRAVLADDGGGQLVLPREGDLHLLRALDDVEVRDDVARAVDHEARPEGLGGLRRRGQEVERVRRHLADARRRDLDDARAVLLVDRLRRQPPLRGRPLHRARGRLRRLRRLLHGGGVLAELPERGSAAERQAAADDGDDQQLGDSEGEEAGSSHHPRYSQRDFKAT
jgi:hypothetical protein